MPCHYSRAQAHRASLCHATTAVHKHIGPHYAMPLQPCTSTSGLTMPCHYSRAQAHRALLPLQPCTSTSGLTMPCHYSRAQAHRALLPLQPCTSTSGATATTAVHKHIGRYCHYSRAQAHRALLEVCSTPSYGYRGFVLRIRQKTR